MKTLIFILICFSTSVFAHNMPLEVKENKVNSIISSKFNQIHRFLRHNDPVGIKTERFVIDKDSLEFSFAAIRLNPMIAILDINPVVVKLLAQPT